jgi:hypothetical protein
MLWRWWYPCFELPSKCLEVSECFSGLVQLAHNFHTAEVLAPSVLTIYIFTPVFSRQQEHEASHMARVQPGSKIAHEYQEEISSISFTAPFIKPGLAVQMEIYHLN